MNSINIFSPARVVVLVPMPQPNETFQSEFIKESNENDSCPERCLAKILCSVVVIVIIVIIRVAVYGVVGVM